MKKLYTFFIGMLCAIAIVNGQNSTAPAAATTTTTDNSISLGDQVKLKIGGFARADVYYDTRKNTELLDGLYLIFPNNASKDGKDLNAVSNFRMSAAATRFSTAFTGPDFLNAKSTAYAEYDFTGVNGYGFRLRHAWVKLKWEKHEVLFGRYWHPMFIVDAFPTVLALSTGAPFCVFNRTEQLRYTWTPGAISTTLSASTQMDYGFQADYDAATGKTTYNHNQLIPDLTANTQFKNDNFILGVSANFKQNQPKLSTISVNNSKISYKTDVKINSYSFMGYAQFKTGLLKIKGSALYGQNMMELNMLGGYAVISRDTTGYEKYATINNMNYWGNIIYGDNLQFGVFVGYTKNLGCSSEQVLELPKKARGYDIDHLVRISPSVSYKAGRLQLWAEIEHTIAAYGTPDVKDHLKVKETKNVANTRLQIASIFYF